MIEVQKSLLQIPHDSLQATHPYCKDKTKDRNMFKSITGEKFYWLRSTNVKTFLRLEPDKITRSLTIESSLDSLCSPRFPASWCSLWSIIKSCCLILTLIILAGVVISWCSLWLVKNSAASSSWPWLLEAIGLFFALKIPWTSNNKCHNTWRWRTMHNYGQINYIRYHLLTWEVHRSQDDDNCICTLCAFWVTEFMISNISWRIRLWASIAVMQHMMMTAIVIHRDCLYVTR